MGIQFVFSGFSVKAKNTENPWYPQVEADTATVRTIERGV